MNITDIHPLRAGDLLRAARKAAGLTRPGLSSITGTHANQIAYIEKTHGAGWATMVNLLDACGFKVTVRRKPEPIPAAFEKANEAALLLRGLGYSARVVTGADGSPGVEFLSPVTIPVGAAGKGRDA